MSEWKAFNARITMFPNGPQPIPSALELYQRFWGDPDGFEKPANPLMPSVAHGKREAMVSSCLAHLTRIDFNLSPVIGPGETGKPEINLIDDTGRLCMELKQIIKDIAGGVKVSSISRVALYLQFVVVRGNFVEANKTLTEVLPQLYRVNVTDEEDFIFQVNRPRKSGKVNSVKMNFITKWSVENVQMMVNLAAPTGGPFPVLAPAPWTKSFLTASVSFDNNNFAERSLTTEEQSKLLDECLSEASRTQMSIGLKVEGF